MRDARRAAVSAAGTLTGVVAGRGDYRTRSDATAGAALSVGAPRVRLALPKTGCTRRAC